MTYVRAFSLAFAIWGLDLEVLGEDILTRIQRRTRNSGDIRLVLLARYTREVLEKDI